MLNCADIEVLVSDYADGTTNARTRRIVEQHIQLCSRCKQRVDRAAQVAQQLRRLPLLPVGVASRVGRFRRQLEARTSGDQRNRLEHYPFYVSALLAASLIVAVLVLIFYAGL